MLTVSTASVKDPTATSTISIRGARDAVQSGSREVQARCEVTAPGRTSQAMEVDITVLGVAQPSFSLVCPLEDELFAESGVTPATCGVSATSNGNSTLLVIGGNAASASPQPPFDETANKMTVRIGGVQAAAKVVPGSQGMRLLVTTPSIEKLQAARGASVDDFVFGYYGIEIFTAAGAHGTLGGSVSVGANHTLIDASTGKQTCAVLGFCPDVSPLTAGIFYSDQCVGWLDPSVDMRWKEEEFFDLFAYDRPPKCRDCPSGCRCPGGRRCRVEPGYFVAGEDLGDAAQPARCAPPAGQRCLGYYAAVGGTQCGVGYKQDSVGCGQCSVGYFREMGACAVCPAVDLVGAVVWPALANLVTAVAAFVAVAGIKLVWMLVSGECLPP